MSLAAIPVAERSRAMMAAAAMAAIALRKKLFSIDGRSPAALTNIFIRAKQNAEAMMQRTPFAWRVIPQARFPSRERPPSCRR